MGGGKKEKRRDSGERMMVEWINGGSDLSIRFGDSVKEYCMARRPSSWQNLYGAKLAKRKLLRIQLKGLLQA